MSRTYGVARVSRVQRLMHARAYKRYGARCSPSINQIVCQSSRCVVSRCASQQRRSGARSTPCWGERPDRLALVSCRAAKPSPIRPPSGAACLACVVLRLCGRTRTLVRLSIAQIDLSRFKICSCFGSVTAPACWIRVSSMLHARASRLRLEGSERGVCFELVCLPCMLLLAALCDLRIESDLAHTAVATTRSCARSVALRACVEAASTGSCRSQCLSG